MRKIHNSEVTRAYWDADHSEPSVDLDARILAAAREGVVAPEPKSSVWWRWAVPVSSVAVVVLAVSVVLKAQREAPEQITIEPPTTANSAAMPLAPPADDGITKEAEPTVKPATQPNSVPAAVPENSPAPPLPAPTDTTNAEPAEPAKPIEAPLGAESAMKGEAVAQGRVQAFTPSPPAARNEAPAMKADAEANVGARLAAPERAGAQKAMPDESPVDAFAKAVEDIRKLLREGKTELAKHRLEALRSAFPERRLPEDLMLP